jgi:hypothetical protein
MTYKSQRHGSPIKWPRKAALQSSSSPLWRLQRSRSLRLPEPI